MMPIVASGAATTPSVSADRLQRRLGPVDELDRDRLTGFGDRRSPSGAGPAWPRAAHSPRLRLLDLLLHVTQHIGRLLEHAAAGRVGADQADLLAQVVLVLRQVLGKAGRLIEQKPSEAGGQRQRDRDHDQHRRRPGQARLPQQADDRRQGEAQEDRQGQRDEDVAAEVKRRDHARGGDHHRAERDGRLRSRQVQRLAQLRPDRGGARAGGRGPVPATGGYDLAHPRLPQLAAGPSPVGSLYPPAASLRPPPLRPKPTCVADHVNGAGQQSDATERPAWAGSRVNRPHRGGHVSRVR